MPGGDGTGPEGLGPNTGRGYTHHTGHGRGFGRGHGYGRGMGYGYRHGYEIDSEEDVQKSPLIMELEEDIKSLREKVDILEKRISESENSN